MKSFRELFDREATSSGVASGRVNLIGEHTDYNGGYVLPSAIPQTTKVELARSDRPVARIVSVDAEGQVRRCEYRIGHEERSDDWRAYLEGATFHLAKEGFTLGGFDALITSTVPIGAGLSSSAALLVSFIRAVAKEFAIELTDVEIARLAQRVENEFVGARVGIMDQMAASLATPGMALFLDTRSLRYRQLALPDTMRLFVINSGVKHSNVHGGYNTRRDVCEEACRRLGIAQLRDLGVEDLPLLDGLPDTLKRRARHVITENQRVLDTVTAIEERNVQMIGSLFLASHASMRDDYEVSVSEIDTLVSAACAEPGVFGARLTGGGFGGSIVGIADPRLLDALLPRILRKYQSTTGREAVVLLP